MALVKNYSHNFLPARIESRIKKRGARAARAIYQKDTANRSQWVNLHHTDYGDHKWRTKGVAAKEA